ncbi:tetratricopeptide repeat protein [Aquifex pyrophilus]
MLKPIKLFSLLLLFIFPLFSQELKKELTLKVKVQEILKVEKPEISIPDKLSYKVPVFLYKGKDLSYLFFEPPKRLEEVELYEPKTEGCGAPKDQVLYKKAIREYKRGNLIGAGEEAKKLLSLPTSPFRNAGYYILGLIEYKRGYDEEALRYFKEGCNTLHTYRSASCESFYALYYKIKGEPYETQEPLLWNYVYLIGGKGKIPESPLKNCGRYTFKEYCRYVNDFIRGRVNEEYRESTFLRRAVVLYEKGELEKAEKILEKFSRKLIPHRDVILYYLSLIALKKGDYDKALDRVLLLETLNEELAKEVYLLLALKNPELADFVYEKTKAKEILRYAGIKAYNRGEYKKAIHYFEKSGDYFYAALAYLQLGNYEKAYEYLKRKKRDTQLYYRAFLEVLYRLDKEEKLQKTLEDIKERFPELYREYYGWYLFKKGDWLEASKYFENPYYKAIAYFNAGDYEKVLEILRDKNDYKSRILKAKAAIALGKGVLARKFLFNETPEELYLTGLSYFIEGNYEKAIPYFNKAAKDKNYEVKALVKLADSYYNMGRKEEAKAVYRLILSKYKEREEVKSALIGLAQIESENPSKEIEKIVEEFEKKFPESPLLPELKLQLARYYAKEGRKIEAQFILRKLINNPEYRERALLELARVTEDPEEREKILLDLVSSKDKLISEKAFNELKKLYEKENNLLKLARLLEKRGDEGKIKAISLYLKLDRVKDAERLFREMYKKYPELEELKEVALKLYEKTGKRHYLDIAYRSAKEEVFLKASYYLGNYYYKKDRRKALDYLLEVVLSDKKELPFYKRAVFMSAEILRKMGAYKDASCILERLKGVELESWEREKLLELKKGLPECGG